LLAVVQGDEGDGSWQSDDRVLAAVLLGRVTAEWTAALEAFADALDAEQPVLRRGGALALGHAGRAPSLARARLAQLMADEEEEFAVRIAAAYAYARVADAVPALADLLETATPPMRVVAVRILGEAAANEPLYRADNIYNWLSSAHDVRPMAASRVLTLLSSALEDDEANVRRSAILALSWLGAQAQPAVRALEREKRLVEAAAEALARIDGRPAPGTVDLDDLYQRLPIDLTNEKRLAFEALYEYARTLLPGNELSYDLPYPKHEFLRYLCDTRGLMLHGSHRGELDLLKPERDSVDAADWGNVSGVYAEPDPVRPIYFAVVERTRSFGLVNGCLALAADGSEDTRLEDPSSTRHYHLTVGLPAIGQDFWRPGWVYALPPDTFEFWEEWTSREPVRPLFRLGVSRDDLPLPVSFTDVRKRGPVSVAPTSSFPYLDDAWAVPIKTAPMRSPQT
jgi:hypothetical protein